MSNKPSHHRAPFPLKKDDTEHYLLTNGHVSVSESGGQGILKVAPGALTLLARQAFHDASSILRPAYQQQVVDILRDPEANENDKYVALQSLHNSNIAAKGAPPTYQDTGTAVIIDKKGQRVWIGGGDETALARGVYNTYIEDSLRYSQNVPLDVYREMDTDTSLPAQIDLYAVDGDKYKFLCITEGGGPVNETYLYQGTKALLTPGKPKNYLVEKMRTLGTAARPPYHIASVIGRTSAEANLEAVKLASAKYYDELPTKGNKHGQAFRDMELERKLLIEAQNLGLGAQFDGKYFAHDTHVTRLPHHGASCPVGMGVSCSADHNIKTKTNRQGIWIGELEHNSGKYIPGELRKAEEGEAVRVDFNRPTKEILAQSLQYPVFTRLLLSGTTIVSRGATRAKLRERMDNGEGLPRYIRDHPIYYTGPARTPGGHASGSLGLTTAGWMDSYVDQLQAQGGNMIMLAKDNRGRQVTDACKKHSDFYLGSIGGPAVVLAQGSIKSLGCTEYLGLGMETIWRIEVEDFPTFILVDDKRNDLFQQVWLTQCTRCVK